MAQARDEDDTDDDETARDIALSHNTFMSLGRLVSGHLPIGVRERLDRLDRPSDLEPMRDELRYATDLDRAAPMEIRVAIAISEICLALEGLVFQDSDEHVAHKIYIKVDGRLVSAGEKQVSSDYLPARIADAILCTKEDGYAVLRQALVMLRDQIASFPDFHHKACGDHLVLIHASDPDRVESVTIGSDANVPADYVIMVCDPPAPEALAAAIQRFQNARWTMREACFGAVFWRSTIPPNPII